MPKLDTAETGIDTEMGLKLGLVCLLPSLRPICIHDSQPPLQHLDTHLKLDDMREVREASLRILVNARRSQLSSEQHVWQGDLREVHDEEKLLVASAEVQQPARRWVWKGSPAAASALPAVQPAPFIPFPKTFLLG